MGKTFPIACPNCGQTLRANRSVLDQKARCGFCNYKFLVDSRIWWRTDLPIEHDPEYIEPAAVEPVPANSSDGAGGAKLEPTLRRVGRFELKAVLGEGTYGIVYRAYDPLAARLVALKLMRFADADERQVQRFLSEAKAAARLSHPNLVSVYEAGQADGENYIAFEHIAGKPLSEWIADERLSLVQMVTWVRDLAAALAAVHAAGIVHRDLKPSNVLIDDGHCPRIADFGLAKWLSDDVTRMTLTSEGGALGTPAYMSPEQARGDMDAVGPPSDQYSLGVMLYELLTGRLPFEGPPHVVISQVATAVPPTPRALLPWIPLDLEKICLKAMAKHPALRYADMSHMKADLDRWLAGQKITTRVSVPLFKRLALNDRPSRLTAILVAAVLLLSAVTGGLTYSYFQMRSQHLLALTQIQQTLQEAQVWAAAPEQVDDEPYDDTFAKWLQVRGGGVSRQQGGPVVRNGEKISPTYITIYFPATKIVHDGGLAKIAHLITRKDVEEGCRFHFNSLVDNALHKLPDIYDDKSLLDLYLWDTSVTDAGLASISKIANLRSLSLSSPTVTDAGLVSISKIANLESLHLSSTSVTDAGLASISKMGSLRSLELSAIPVTDQGLQEIANLTALNDLHLSRTQITANGLRALRRMEQLSTLDLSDNHVAGGLEHLRPLTRLANLRLNNSHLNDQDMAVIGSLQNLRYLYLYGTSITDVGCAHLQGLQQLQSLTLGKWRSSNISSDNLAAIAKLSQLRSLSLHGRVTDADVEPLQDLKNLQHLELLDAHLTAQGMDSLANLAQLQTLTVNDEGLTEERVRHLTRLTNLNSLSIQCPKLKASSLEPFRTDPQIKYLQLNGQFIISPRPGEGMPASPRLF